MTEISTPEPLCARFADRLRATKSDFVRDQDGTIAVDQHGAAWLDGGGFPGWPTTLNSVEAVIETYVGGRSGVTATSDNDPFVSAWLPLAEWMNTSVRDQLAVHGVELADDAYVTASITPTDQLEGLAHMDDDTYLPDASVAMVAIIGQLTGPRVATGSLTPSAARPMGQVMFSAAQLDDFAADRADHCRCGGDQLVVFPQFAQLHAGPAAEHVAGLASQRQLLVMRAAVR